MSQIVFNSDIIDIEKMQILSKDELIKSIDTTKFYHGRPDDPFWRRFPYNLVTKGSESQKSDYIMYIEPLSQNSFILDKNVYKLGMPIVMERGYRFNGSVSKQKVILIKGKPEWADSSYKGFTILPVANSGDEGDLDFNYTIKEIEN